MLPDTPTFYLVTAFVLFTIGFSKGGFGGLGGIATPMMALVLPVDVAIGLLLPLLMMTDVFAVAVHWQRWDRRLLISLLPASLIGITLGTLLITALPEDALRMGLGLFVLLFGLYRLFEGRIQQRLTYRAQGWHGPVAGASAGFFSTVAHAGGPPIAIFLILQQVTPAVFVGTMNAYFFVTNWLKVPYYLWAGILDLRQLLPILWLLPLLPVGVWTGRRLVHTIDRTLFERIILGLLFFSAVLLLTT